MKTKLKFRNIRTGRGEEKKKKYKNKKTWIPSLDFECSNLCWWLFAPSHSPWLWKHGERELHCISQESKGKQSGRRTDFISSDDGRREKKSNIISDSYFTFKCMHATTRQFEFRCSTVQLALVVFWLEKKMLSAFACDFSLVSISLCVFSFFWNSLRYIMLGYLVIKARWALSSLMLFLIHVCRSNTRRSFFRDESKSLIVSLNINVHEFMLDWLCTVCCIEQWTPSSDIHNFYWYLICSTLWMDIIKLCINSKISLKSIPCN